MSDAQDRTASGLYRCDGCGLWFGMYALTFLSNNYEVRHDGSTSGLRCIPCYDLWVLSAAAQKEKDRRQ